jgi:hypothetical protein
MSPVSNCHPIVSPPRFESTGAGYTLPQPPSKEYQHGIAHP